MQKTLPDVRTFLSQIAPHGQVGVFVTLQEASDILGVSKREAIKLLALSPVEWAEADGKAVISRASVEQIRDSLSLVVSAV